MRKREHRQGGGALKREVLGQKRTSTSDIYFLHLPHHLFLEGMGMPVCLGLLKRDTHTHTLLRQHCTGKSNKN